MKAFDILKAFIYGLFLAVIVFLIQKDRGFGLLHCLSDACFVPGVLLGGSGGLLFVSSRGVFDMMFYGVHSLFTVTFRRERRESYIEYAAGSRERRRDFRPLLITGAVFIILSVIFLGINQVDQGTVL